MKTCRNTRLLSIAYTILKLGALDAAAATEFNISMLFYINADLAKGNGTGNSPHKCLPYSYRTEFNTTNFDHEPVTIEHV